ncbi:MAG: serine/threonine-protein kinase [Gemmataceae bacterium]
MSLSEQPTIGMDATRPAGPAPDGERFGDYVLLGELGRGGMGVVYRALETSIGRHVAVKMILSQALADPSELARFQAEASAAGRLQHPHIVKVLRVGTQDERHYYAMDFIDGPSLAQRVAAGPLPGRQAAALMVTVSRAIHHAHEQGILHRDLKPGNILLDAAGTPHVADFGLAKQMSADSGHTRTGAVMGTPGYMSPEQARGAKDLTAATDVYGLGAVLYELLTGRPPFRGETALDTLLMVMDNEPVPPRLLNPDVDHDLETVCLKAIARDPRDRYASAAELADDLQRYLEGESIAARSMNVLDYIGRTLERSQFDVEFRPYGNMLLVFAAVVAAGHVIKQAVTSSAAPVGVVAGVQIGQFVALLAVLWWYRARGLVPNSTAERQLYSLVAGYMLACVLTSQFLRMMFDVRAMYEGKIYPFYCALTGMVFFVLGSSYWGKFYAAGAWFFALGVVLAWSPDAAAYGALAFGGSWSLALVAIGLRLRSLGHGEPGA